MTTQTAEPTTEPTQAEIESAAQAAAVVAGVAAALPAALDAYFANNMTGFVLGMDKAKTQLDACKVFSGTVVDVKKEQSSTRGLVTLNTGTDREKDGLNAGEEQVRTERTDNPEGLAMAKKVRELKGRRVLVWVEVEEIKGGSSKVRVLRHIQDIGVAR